MLLRTLNWLVAKKLALHYNLREKYQNPPTQFLICTEEIEKWNLRLCVCVRWRTQLQTILLFEFLQLFPFVNQRHADLKLFHSIFVP